MAGTDTTNFQSKKSFFKVEMAAHVWDEVLEEEVPEGCWRRRCERAVRGGGVRGLLEELLGHVFEEALDLSDGVLEEVRDRVRWGVGASLLRRQLYL